MDDIDWFLKEELGEKGDITLRIIYVVCFPIGVYKVGNSMNMSRIPLLITDAIWWISSGWGS